MRGKTVADQWLWWWDGDGWWDRHEGPLCLRLWVVRRLIFVLIRGLLPDRHRREGRRCRLLHSWFYLDGHQRHHAVRRSTTLCLLPLCSLQPPSLFALPAPLFGFRRVVMARGHLGSTRGGCISMTTGSGSSSSTSTSHHLPVTWHTGQQIHTQPMHNGRLVPMEPAVENEAKVPLERLLVRSFAHPIGEGLGLVVGKGDSDDVWMDQVLACQLAGDGLRLNVPDVLVGEAHHCVGAKRVARGGGLSSAEFFECLANVGLVLIPPLVHGDGSDPHVATKSSRGGGRGGGGWGT
mmetsp:Transcript_1810/g.5006  ORF Transcript_1810/g.5006 Transcript_1810/m.5006 type:complete len:293 (+) Transcript_1810:227-1105(+)